MIFSFVHISKKYKQQTTTYTKHSDNNFKCERLTNKQTDFSITMNSRNTAYTQIYRS